MSYYYYNESDGSVQWTRPGPTQTADRSLPSSTTRPTINNNSTPPPGIPPPPRTAPKVSRLSTYSDDSDISGRNGGASHREGDKDISIEDDTAEEEINRAPSPHAEAPALAAENQLSSDSILSGLGEFKGPLRGDGDMNFERNQSASSSSVYYTARSSSPTKPFGSGRFSVGGADMKTSDPPVRVKVYFQDDIFVILVPRMTEYDELVAKVQRKMLLCGPRRDDGPLRIKYRDEDGDMVSLGSTEDVQMAFEQYRPGGCVTLHAT
ncbi:hypothetical protein FB451DRAFT_1083058 [Mycena latifolia]|nr:hypothetical protein FB451DRAFT_1083058 [Mycena latifolia]